jgi:hypothetical protein
MASGRLSKVKGKVVDIPNPPTIGTATAGSLSASVTFTAYSGGVGGPTRSYIAKSNPGNITATGSTSPITVTGLTGDTSYTISVAGVNETGNSEYSSASNSVTATNPGSYESIATVTVGSSGSSTITFSSIPSTFTHLQLRAIARSARTEPEDYVYLRFNSDTGNNYAWHDMEGSGSSLTAQAVSSTAQIFTLFITTANSSANIFGAGVIDILDYANTNKYKTVRTLSGDDKNGSGYVVFGSGLWQNTNAVSTITLTNHGATNFQQYSSFALYGIKGA